MGSIRLKRPLSGLALVAAMLSLACGVESPGPTTTDGGGDDGHAGEYTLARIGVIALPEAIEDCSPTRFTGGQLHFYNDGTWEFAVAVKNGAGDTPLHMSGRYEQAGRALWFESEDGETFQGTVAEDGLIAIDYDACRNGRTDMQLIFAR